MRIIIVTIEVMNTLPISKRKGFTLIELLVVIAIIGVLAAVVTASLLSTRRKGDDTAVRSALNQIYTQANIVYGNQGCYGDNDGGMTCANRFTSDANCYVTLPTENSLFKEPKVVQILNAARAAGGEYSACRSTLKGHANSLNGVASWAVAVRLPSDPTRAWCVDSFGNSLEIIIGQNNESAQNQIDRAINRSNSNTNSGITGCNLNYPAP